MKKIIFMSLSCALLLGFARVDAAVSFGGHRNSVQSAEQDASLKDAPSNQRAERKSRLSLGSQRLSKNILPENDSAQGADSLSAGVSDLSVQTSPTLTKRRPAPQRTKKAPSPPVPPRPNRNSALVTSGQTPPPLPPRPDRNSTAAAGAGPSWTKASVSKNKWRGMGAHDKVSAGVSRFLDKKSLSGLNISAVKQALSGGGDRNDKFLFDIKTYAAMQQDMPSPDKIKKFMAGLNEIHDKLNRMEQQGEKGITAAFRQLQKEVVKDLIQVKSALQSFGEKDVYIQELIRRMQDVQLKLSNPQLTYDQVIEEILNGISHIQQEISGLKANARKNYPNINKTIARLKQYGLTEIQMDHIPRLGELGIK